MAIPNRLQRLLIRRAGIYVHPVWPARIETPIFVVGSPRSGTSIFGRILGQQPNFLYLYEPRVIWRTIDPDFNVWRGGEAHHGQLVWTAGDGTSRHRERLARWLHFASFVGRGRRVVEKMPLNVFRLEWLAAAFPQARFVHVIRHGGDVALSLQKAVERWFSRERGYPPHYWENSWHYQMFVDYARRHAELTNLAENVGDEESNFERGLRVWAACVHAGRHAGEKIGAARYREIRYEELVQDTASSLVQLFHFLEEEPDSDVLAFAREQLHARSIAKPQAALLREKDAFAPILERYGYG